MTKPPKHIAIIMDGNGRWAQRRHQPRSFGHIKGTRVAKSIITECSDIGIEFLTLYAFSTENWMRPESEVGLLMKILKRYLHKETDNMVKKNIQFAVIGDKSRLPADVRAAVDSTIEKTKSCTGLKLSFALNYGSRQEIVSAVQKISELVKNGSLKIDEINEAQMSHALQTSGTPDPELILRTSGELRLSNFLLWQAAYSEFWFSDKLWPDFTTADLHQALLDFSGRKRRFGKLKVDSQGTDEKLHN